MANAIGSETDALLKNMVGNLSAHLEDYHDFFQNETSDGHELSRAYLMGLLKTEAGKRNLERINEEIDVSGGDGDQRIQQFITDSPWSAGNRIGAIAQDTSSLSANQPNSRGRDVGYIIDESAHLKKGKYSVGVARQSAGVIGQVENCQVGVYASLVWESQSTLINERLFLPTSWTADSKRCDQAGIPEKARQFKTKIELALEMIQSDLAAGVDIGWVGGDGLYGHGLELGFALDNIGLNFLLDVHCDQMIDPLKPILSVPESAGRGRKPTKLQADRDPTQVRWYADHLYPFQWRTIAVRNGAKGPITLSVHTAPVWVWDGKSERVTERVLVISRNHADNKIKYSLSHVDDRSTPIERLAYMQAQRDWVERAFQEAKSELGMSDDQVRKWNAWHHHMALVMLSLSFIVKERLLHKTDYPLVSCRDLRLLIIALLLNDPDAVEKRIKQMRVRHEQRRKDIERHYKLTATG
jgi:SRSO17 transposase